MFPVTLEIRNTPDGCIWQIYHLQSQEEVNRISNTAGFNGFESCEVVPFQPEESETFPRWRNDVEWTTLTCPRCNQKPCICT